MCEMMVARLKMGLFIALFLSPILVQVWSMRLDAFLNGSQSYPPLVTVNAGAK